MNDDYDMMELKHRINVLRNNNFEIKKKRNQFKSF
jgi:hypothetical protein